jgi:putative Holliday junction resolvase
MTKKIISLDVGEKRIGVAIGDTSIRIASPYITLLVDGSEIDKIEKIIDDNLISAVVIGYPRNQSGEATKQTEYIKIFAKMLVPLNKNIIFQDESLTSVLAEERLKSYKKPYAKADIDSQAACIILQDYLEGLKK